jgi:hypothetical protein
MGLWISHDCWEGAYGGFRGFREYVGRAAGLPYRLITDPDAYDCGSYTLDVDWDIYPIENLAGKWHKAAPVWQQKGDIYGNPKQDDVLYLLIHSDADGELRNGYLPRLKARLEELEPAYDALIAKASDQYSAGKLRRFIDGLGTAIESGENVRFG